MASHVLKRLNLPARYEKLEEQLGSDVAKLLTSPETTLEALKRISLATAQSGEGQLVPCYGGTGAGKTTLAENLSYFLPSYFAATLTYQGPISFDLLAETCRQFREKNTVPADRVQPINIDHREGAPPSDEELAAIKRYLRTAGFPIVMLWLEVDKGRAEALSKRYVDITGQPAVPLPLAITGPDRKTWQDIAVSTIELCNPIPQKQISEIGLSPRDYDVSSFPSIGEFLKKLSNDFANLVAEHEASTRKPVTLIIAYVGESHNRGVLPSFTHGGDPGLLNSHALLESTPESMIGKRWAQKRGVLTQTIFRLDARAFWFPPAALIAMQRKFGSPQVQKVLKDRSMPSPIDIKTYLERTDFGRYYLGNKGASYETRGRPSEEAGDFMKKLGKDFGYGSGKDKILNQAMATAIGGFMAMVERPAKEAKAESALGFASGIIPDNQFEFEDRIICVEYVWRTGDGLDSSKRSEAAQYALEKLHNYAVNLGWTTA